MVKVYFVRHAQSFHPWEDDRTRPLTEEGRNDVHAVTQFLKDKNIDRFYCSPYIRSIDTIAESAEYFKKGIITDERLRERENGKAELNIIMIRKRWEDLTFHEEGGESIAMVQERNISALRDILAANTRHNQDTAIVIGTHGTALSSILKFYDPSYNGNSFLRILDWMPYIIELDFDGEILVGQQEHIHINKVYIE